MTALFMELGLSGCLVSLLTALCWAIVEDDCKEPIDYITCVSCFSFFGMFLVSTIHYLFQYLP